MNRSFICLAVCESTIDNNLKQALKYKNYIDMVELRADFLETSELSYIPCFPKKAGLPAILTFRRTSDGGRFKINENERIRLIEKFATPDYHYIDLEADVTNSELDAKIESYGIKIIRSFHDLNGIPENLTQKMKTITHSEREIPKAAVFPKTTADLLSLLETSNDLKGRENILIGMGTFGFPTRILSSVLGSYLSFCSVPDKLAAPGQIDPVTLNELYRFKEINRNTKIFGIIGNPVMHTSSPVIHNRGFADLGLDAIYLPFHVDKVEDFINIARLLPVKGFSVTIPHKETIIRYLDIKEDSIPVVGACNTVIKKGSNLFGTNTDIDGFLKPLKEQAGIIPLSGKKATVIGAGGAAKGIVFGLIKEGVKVLILNRTRERAKDLALRSGCVWAGLDDAGIKMMEEYCDIIAQATNTGMEPDIDKDPISGYQFKGHEIVYDIIYKPSVTAMLKRAKAAGCKIITGKEMLLEQAFAQFWLFTGCEYPDKEEIRNYL